MTTAKAYVRERNAALLGSIDEFEQWCHRRHSSRKVPVRPILEISYHQMRTAAVTLPMEARQISKRWLLERQLMPWDDGDIPV
jgi:hypothetical protein